MNVFLERAYKVFYAMFILGLLILLISTYFKNSPVFGISLITVAITMYFFIQLACYLKENQNEVQKSSKT